MGGGPVKTNGRFVMLTISTLALRKRVSTHCETKAGNRNGLVLILAASLAAIPVADSAIERILPRLAPVAEAATSILSGPAPEVLPKAVAGSATPEREIEAVAAAVAKRYRVSFDATRPFVSAAFMEGARIGVDPLLIIAVIAIESRFNPIAQSDGGALGLMQVIPRYHAHKLDAADRDSVLDPPKNIELGAKVLKEYIKRGGTEVAGLQLYNGASDDPSNAYAGRVLGEKQRLRDAVRRARDAGHA
jgi:soluble lytic murein transglycosylase-like protein